MKSYFLKTILFNHSELKNNPNYEYIRNIWIFQNNIELSESITYFVWENWAGKSTLLETIAEVFWCNKEWWTKNTLYKTNATDNTKNNWITLSWQPSMYQYWYFFRAEWIYNFVNYLEDIKWFTPYGWENLHKMSHWQQFLKILESQMDKKWFYILDEIESALSPENQLKVIEIIKYMVNNGSQFLIATHSPIILSIKENSQILSFDHNHIHSVEYDMVPCVDMYRRILKKTKYSTRFK